ncbi:FixH family protein [Guptibacillus hwajinpoensis]|uniref:FixH family protein n=1 Tax=Guptibacillus hwajinpoensis TaxID=208199 RepID=UPI001CD5C554|nr:FixH family protein [Pseudalkalibacillus hwajinpoensis]MCA0993727.1 FixH family protein [Pseudalkalibacillus hwajinpoensis]
MKKGPIALGMACLLALGACSDPGNGAGTGGTSSEEMSSVNSEEAGSTVESNGEGVGERADAGIEIKILEDQADDREHEHGGHVSISLKKDVMDSRVLVTTVTEAGEPLTEANVRFEYWLEGEEKHTYTDADENSEGVYEGISEFSEPGAYKLKVHVEKGDELHAHKPYLLEVAEKE